MLPRSAAHAQPRKLCISLLSAICSAVTAIAARSMLSQRTVEAYGHRFQILVTALGGHFFPLQDPAGTAALVRQALAD